MFNTKLRASASEKLVEADLMLQGYETFFPSAYGGDQDLIVIANGKSYKIQVKCGSVDGNKLRVDVRKSSNAKERLYGEDSFDILAIVHLDSRRVAYLRREAMTALHSVNMWLDGELPTKGFHPEYTPLMFESFLQFPIR